MGILHRHLTVRHGNGKAGKVCFHEYFLLIMDARKVPRVLITGPSGPASPLTQCLTKCPEGSTSRDTEAKVAPAAAPPT